MHALHKLIKHNLVNGLPPYKYGKDRVCSACLRGKQVHASFKPLKSVSTLRYLEVANGHLWTNLH